MASGTSAADTTTTMATTAINSNNKDDGNNDDDTTTVATTTTTITTTSRYQRVRPLRPTTGFTTTFVLKQLTVGGNKIIRPQLSSSSGSNGGGATVDLTLAPSLLTTAAINEIGQQNTPPAKRNPGNNFSTYASSRRKYANRRYSTTTSAAHAQTPQNEARTGKSPLLAPEKWAKNLTTIYLPYLASKRV